MLLCCFTTAFASEPLSSTALEFPPNLESYGDAGLPILERLSLRIEADPFNLVGTLIFLLAVTHTFLCSKFAAAAHRLEHQHELKRERGEVPRTSVSHRARLMHFLGEVEVVFGVWAVLLLFAVVVVFNWPTAVDYVSHGVNYTEAIFVVVIMTLASTRPILKLSEASMQRVADLLGGSLKAWWFSILTLGPLLGSFITEPAAMTISALLLIRRFYALEPNNRLKYATLGMLFVNISVGGTLTHFAAPPVLMVAEPWGWDTGFMLSNFGWKAVLGIIISNALFLAVFWKELSQLEEQFTVRCLREEILTKYFSREEMESELDAVSEETGDLEEMNERIRRVMEDYAERVEGQLKERYLEHISKTDIDMELAKSAFSEQFAAVKLFRLQREVPTALPKDQRAPFMDPNWDQREDAVPRWVTVRARIAVFPGVRGGNCGLSEHYQSSTTTTGRLLSRRAGHTWWSARLVDRACPRESGSSISHGCLDVTHWLQRQCGDHLSGYFGSGVHPGTEIRRSCRCRGRRGIDRYC
jgi:hypothetical protein